MLPSPTAWPHFRYHIKQRGALLAKGRLLGVQFQALMENGHYRELCKKAAAQAQRIKAAFLKKGFPMLCDTVTNQIFPRTAQRHAGKAWRRVQFCALGQGG